MIDRLARGIRGFAAFWWDFVIGDDWRIAVGVAVALGATWALSTTPVAAWWLLPLAVATLLGVSLRRAIRAARRSDQVSDPHGS